MLLVPQPKYVNVLSGSHVGPVADAVCELDEGLPHQAYRVRITQDVISIQAGSDAGFFYAQKTIEQLYKQSWPEQGLPCVEIEDSPDFPERGFMLDISRCKVPTMATLKRLVDLLAYLKFNQLQLYTEHTFAYAGHELVWGDASPMTGEEILELDAYCRERFVELVPNQNSFGHMERWLRYPEYHHLAESPDGFIHPLTGKHVEFGSTLKPDEQSLSLINELYTELLPNFTSRKLHGGCDETWELGQGSSKVQADAEGVGTVYMRFVKRIAELAASHDKELQFWADGLLKHPELLSEVPESAIPVIWGYESDFPFDDQCRLIADAELPFYIAPGDSTWNSFTGRLAEAEPNIQSAARHGLRHGARGLLLTHWGDNGHFQTWPMLFPGLLCAAASSWNASAPLTEIEEAIERLLVDDTAGTFGGVICGLAHLDTALGIYRMNNSFLFQAFFMPNSELVEAVKGMDEDKLFHAFERLDAISGLLKQADLDCDDAEWLMDELQLAIGFCYKGLRRIRLAKEGQSTENLRPAFKELIGQHEKIWLRRNRIGGLHESSGRLRAVFEQL